MGRPGENRTGGNPTEKINHNAPFVTSALSVAHMLFECHHCNTVIQRHFNVTTHKEFFDMVSARDILAFYRASA